MMGTAEVALVISGAAFVASAISLWVNSVMPFRLRVSHDAPTFSLYKITPEISGDEEGRTWWIPSFDLGISFYNTGRLPGEILDLRIVAKFKGHRTTRRYVFYPKWIVNYPQFQELHAERFEWINKAVVREWYSFLLKGQSEKELHVVLETDRWEQRETGSMHLCLQYIASAKREWMTAAEYEFHVSDDMFDEKATYTAHDEKVEGLRKL
jgi:hypothetical protein